MEGGQILTSNPAFSLLPSPFTLSRLPSVYLWMYYPFISVCLPADLYLHLSVWVTLMYIFRSFELAQHVNHLFCHKTQTEIKECKHSRLQKKETYCTL